MPKVLTMKLSTSSINSVIEELERYSAELTQKGLEICRRLANVAELRVSQTYASASYVGEKDYVVTVEERNNGYAVLADGMTVLLLEFGAGVTYGYGHPQAGEFGMGPGTYPGQTHAFAPQGWLLPKEKGGQHTYGNAPSMAMYFAAKDLREEVETVAREVFSR